MSRGGSGDIPATNRLREWASATLVVGLPGPWITRSDVRSLEALSPAGVILFARNIEDASQLVALTSQLRELLDHPLLMLDLEGGRVDRLRPLLGPSPAPRLLARRGADAVASHADQCAEALSALGFNFNCAPMVDLDEGIASNALGDRCLSSDPVEVANLARLVMASHDRHGVMTCLKHFPGLGRTDRDTHAARPVVSVSRESLFERELLPYRLLADLAPAVMVGHASYPGISGDDTPADLSRPVVDGCLRRQIGFNGLVLTDDLDMGAIQDRGLDLAVREAVAAGCDLLLSCGPDLGRAALAQAALVKSALDGSLPWRRLEEAASHSSAARRATSQAGATRTARIDQRMRELAENRRRLLEQTA